MVLSSDDRYWAKVQKGDPGECWLWLGAKSKRYEGARGGVGYGFFYDGTRTRLVTRWTYERFVGPIAPGLQVCHTCDNPSCVNPMHLWLGTGKQNLDDMRAKGRERVGRAVGGRNANSKLTDAQRVEIQQRYSAGGISQQKLADEYGVSDSAIWHVIHSKNHGEARPVGNRGKRVPVQT